MRPTIFTLLYMIAIMLGVHICAVTGFKSFGLSGGTIGALVGGAFVYIMGCLTHSAMNRLTERYYRRKSTVFLRACLDEASTAGSYISCLIISILLERGDSVDSLRNFVFRQLDSGDVCERQAGLVNLRLYYPILAGQLKGFNVFSPTKNDLVRLKEIETHCDM